jgi:hypothetical protein
MIKHFHELREEEFAWLIAEGTTWGEIPKDFPGPPWCKEQGIVVDPFGCWSLIAIGKSYRITSEADCQGCELYKPSRTGL